MRIQNCITCAERLTYSQLHLQHVVGICSWLWWYWCRWRRSTSVCEATWRSASRGRQRGVLLVRRVQWSSSTTHPLDQRRYDPVLHAPIRCCKLIVTVASVLSSRPAEGRRLSWPGWLGQILRSFPRQKMLTHLSICRRGRELNPRPSSRKSNALTTRLPSHLLLGVNAGMVYFTRG